MSVEEIAEDPKLPIALRDWKIPFLGRQNERELFSRFVNSADRDTAHRLIVRGDSGTGKSYFTRTCLSDALQAKPDSFLCVYVDLSNDEFQSARLVSSILKLSMVAAEPRLEYPLKIPPELTFEKFKRMSSDRKSIGWNVIRGLSQAAASFAGMGDAARELLDGAGEASTTTSDVLFEYLKWVSVKRSILLAVDNYQFLNHDVRLTLESMVARVGANIKYIVVDRTVDDTSQIVPPVQRLNTHDVEISLGRFNPAETKSVVAGSIDVGGTHLDRLSADIFSKTKGLPKDIEYCLRHYLISSQGSPEKIDITGLLATIDRLPMMHRQFLIVASLLDGGIDESLAKNVVRRVASLSSDTDLERTLTDLITREYLKLNSDTGLRLRAGHERVINSMRKLASQEAIDDVRRSLIEEFATCLDRRSLPDNEAYLLHCLVGIQTAAELRGNLHFISRLVRAQSRLEQFAYLVSLSEEIGEVLPLLPESTVVILLDAMQKTSSFERGLQLLRKLEMDGALDESELTLYRFKFLNQLYQYDEANKLLDKLSDDPWSIVYQVSSLISQDKFSCAETIAKRLERIQEINEPKAILLRNTIVLKRPEIALDDLCKAAKFFERIDGEYRLATIETNKSLVHLCTQRYGDASRSLDRSVQLMQRVGSREIYQAYFNRAICNALQGNLHQAWSDFELASDFTPAALLLDAVKIDMAMTAFKFVVGEIEVSVAVDLLKEQLAKIKGVQLPYLRKSLDHNILALTDPQHETSPVLVNRLASSEQVSLYLPVHFSGTNPLIVNPSIHLRY